MPIGIALLVGIRYSVIVPPVVIFPILLPLSSVNQRLPSGPLAMPIGNALLVGIRYSVMGSVGVGVGVGVAVAAGVALPPPQATKPNESSDVAARIRPKLLPVGPEHLPPAR